MSEKINLFLFILFIILGIYLIKTFKIEASFILILFLIILTLLLLAILTDKMAGPRGTVTAPGQLVQAVLAVLEIWLAKAMVEILILTI